MSVRVVARIRPLLEKELGKDVIVTADRVEEGKPYTLVKIPNPKNESEEFSFAFNRVYEQGTSQEDLFSAEVAPHMKALFQGLDVTIFAYGATGTGKTHTMRGVIPRLLSNVFCQGKKIIMDSDGETNVDVSLSYYEIYNDKVFDLLKPQEKRTPSGLLLRDNHGKTVVVGLSERPCGDLKDFEQLYLEANNNRVTAATKLNAHSSRSHAILRVKVTQTTGDMVRESTASAIDLAGSEDNRRIDNGKERLAESVAINKSLLMLSQCIDAISRGDKWIPYRNSKMTRSLSLGQNNGITIMILNLAPMRCYHLDTLSSLNFSSRVKRIEVREVENEVVYKQPPRPASISGSIMRQPRVHLASSTEGSSMKPAESSEHHRAKRRLGQDVSIDYVPDNDPKNECIFSRSGTLHEATDRQGIHRKLQEAERKRKLELLRREDAQRAKAKKAALQAEQERRTRYEAMCKSTYDMREELKAGREKLWRALGRRPISNPVQLSASIASTTTRSDNSSVPVPRAIPTHQRPGHVPRICFDCLVRGAQIYKSNVDQHTSECDSCLRPNSTVIPMKMPPSSLPPPTLSMCP